MTMPHLGQLLLGGINEIIGLNDLEEICQKAGIKFHKNILINGSDIGIKDNFQSIDKSITDKFGVRSGKGIIYRSGGALSKKLRLLWGKEMGFDSNEYRFLSTQQRIHNGIGKFTNRLANELGLEIKTEDTKRHWVLTIIPRNSYQESQNYCQLVSGIISEFINWAGNGKTFLIEERECVSDNQSHCSIYINKSPLDA